MSFGTHGGNTSDLRDARGGFGKSSLFFVYICLSLESGCLEKGMGNVKSTAVLVVSEALPLARENLR